MTLLTLLLALSALNARDFQSHWTVESESPDYRTEFRGDTVEITAPKGLTLWRRERMEAPVVIEYDARLLVDGNRVPGAGDKPGTACDRPSDLNCFVMASDPKTRDVFRRMEWRSGIFVRCYTLANYYVGYGGNGNTTTRFRRYDGNERGVEDKDARPAILTEYTDRPHLNVPNRWRHVRIIVAEGKFIYEIDGERLVSYSDSKPLKRGWFGFRTTWSRFQMTNFSYRRYDPAADNAVTLGRIGGGEAGDSSRVAVHFGVPYPKGAVQPDARFTLDGDPVDFRALAYWPDGSVKWGGFEGTAPVQDSYELKPIVRTRNRNKTAVPALTVQDGETQWVADNGCYRLYVPKQPETAFLDSMQISGTPEGQTTLRGASLIAQLTSEAEEHTCRIDSVRLLRQGQVSAAFKVWGHLEGAQTPSFILHLYLAAGTPQVRLVHTFIYNIGKEESAPFGSVNTDPMICALGVRFNVPLTDAMYNRHVFFATDTAVWHESVQNLAGRKPFSEGLNARQRAGEAIDSASFREMDRYQTERLATWDGFRLSQLNDLGWTLRKRAKGNTPWIGTFAGTRAPGLFALSDTHGGLSIHLKDFWQSYPSTLQIDGATRDEATMTVYLWSPETEPMDLRHYDTGPHDLIAAYEDVQEGMSSPFGIGRTSELVFEAVTSSQGLEQRLAGSAERDGIQLLPSPRYLHGQRAFGVWSLPTGDSLEADLKYWCDFYRREQDVRHWYGYWNYGDFMHAYDRWRGEWMYDVGGFAWDNTELASPMFLWYNFLRTGDAKLWEMAVAMTRHCSETDVYHEGPWKSLGSRHNVTHWGCGAKESRISEAQWNRFYYYLSGGDDRTGDLMTAVRDADTLLYRLDPMRLAQPREQYPCTAPARLRIGPDWLGYVSNWMTEYERTLNPLYLNKILAGMRSINAMPNGIFTGPKALGYDPATGEISWEGDPEMQNTNHLLPIMGGFEMMNELLPYFDGVDGTVAAFAETWTRFCEAYPRKAVEISNNRFLIPRLPAYAYSKTGKEHECYVEAWRQLKRERQTPERFSTNGISCYGLDLIYMLEACPRW